MASKQIEKGTLHEIPDDLKSLLSSNLELLEKWNSLTPLARNEWICWVTIVKKEETRVAHIIRLSADLLKGNRRPCCWPGCPHRRPSAAKFFK
jgi:uncharacterized protein YdeI (YjbR/CyaY-like superfamily)